MGMAVGATIAEVDPAVIRAGDVRAEVVGGLDLAATPSGERHPRWRRTRRLRGRLDRLFAPLALGLARVTGKRLGVALSFGWVRHRWRTLATLPKPTEQQSQKTEENLCEQVESQVELHDQPLPSGEK
jgi:hypothetical protein